MKRSKSNVSNPASTASNGAASSQAAPHRKNAAQRNRSNSPYQGRTAQKDNPTQLIIKQAVDFLIQQVEAGKSETLASYLTAMARFHNYSFGNIVAIARQRPTATRVAGFGTWKELGRFVKRGERGIQILAPMVGYRRKSSEAAQNVDADANTKPRPVLIGFRAVYVFERLSRDLRPRFCGFRTNNLIAIEVVASSRRPVMDALASDPELDTIAAASAIPLNGAVPTVTIRAENGPTISTAHNDVSPEYFGILGIPILRGRNFTKQESTADMPVAILSAGAAQSLFAGRDAVGRILHVSGKAARDVWVIGVAADIVTCCIPWGKDSALVYLPATPATSANVLVHVRGEVEAERHRLDMRLAALAPGAIGDIHSLDQYRALGMYPFWAASMIAATLGGLALLLTLTGIYGVVSYFVTQRTKEIGIRVALGATTLTVVGLVLKQSLRLTAIGTVLGTGLAIGLSRLLASRLVFMRVFDGAAFSGGILLVVFAALAAGYIPSRRAAQIDPIETLRYD